MPGLSRRKLLAATAATALSGCLPGGADVTRRVDAPALDGALPNGDRSALIDGLLARRSVLPEGPLREVAEAVLAANARAAEAELRAAQLRAQAAAVNWLPTLGPQVSLTSLGDLVTTLVVEQVLFDNGRKQAERDFARADVELAAVTLSQDSNTRVREALDLYLTAQAALARAGVNQTALSQMDHYAHVMSRRVAGGVSTRVELNIVEQKREQMRSDLARDREVAAAAMAELQAMAAAPVEDITGLSQPGTELVAEPLSVTRAQAQAARTVAEARASRSGLLPGLTARGSLGSDGSDGGLILSAAQGLGLGTGANLQALEASEAAAERQVAQAREDARRQIAALEGRLASQQNEAAEAVNIAAQAAENFEQYAAQQRAGQRTVTDVIGLFETKVRAERRAVTLHHDALRTAIEIAAVRGVLVNGEDA